MKKSFKKFLLLVLSSFLTFIFLFKILLPISSIAAFAGGSSTNKSEIKSEKEGYLYSDTIPLNNQPFFDVLESKYEIWKHNPIGNVVSKSPQESLINFYALMSIVGDRVDSITNSASSDPGFGWSEEAQNQIEETEHLFELAVDSLDASDFPESVRSHLADESAIEIKHLIDYVFYTSKSPINLIDKKKLKNMPAKSLDKVFVWRLLSTPISLTNKIGDDGVGFGYRFSTETVKNAASMYKEIKPELKYMPSSKYFTPNFYNDFIHTPGHLVSPKWYLNLPIGLRQFLERDFIFGETFFQIFFAGLAILIYIYALFICTRKVINIFASINEDSLPEEVVSKNRNIFLYSIPFVPITKLFESFIDNYLNFTGSALVILTFIFEVILFSISVFVIVFFFEAFGKFIVFNLKNRNLNSRSKLEVKRQAGLVLPILRSIAALISVSLIYKLLLLLGLSPSLVLALSAVPGLAIGLGASKLLGNLFAGLSIQADDHLRIGEFCKVGDVTGFVTRIGLRSIEIQTLESKVTIPNSSAEESVIENFSAIEGDQYGQGLSLKLTIPSNFSPRQIKILVTTASDYLNDFSSLLNTTVSTENSDGSLKLIIYCLLNMSELDTWDEYISMRETLLDKINELIVQVDGSERKISVAFETSKNMLRDIPNIVKEILESDNNFKFEAMNLLYISDFSYDYILELNGSHNTLDGFENGISKFNQKLIQKFNELNIEIPYPTERKI